MFKKPRNSSKFLVLFAIIMLINSQVISSRSVIRTETHNIGAAKHNHNTIVFDGPEEQINLKLNLRFDKELKHFVVQQLAYENGQEEEVEEVVQVNKVVKTENRIINNQQNVLKVQTLGLKTLPIDTKSLVDDKSIKIQVVSSNQHQDNNDQAKIQRQNQNIESSKILSRDFKPLSDDKRVFIAISPSEEVNLQSETNPQVNILSQQSQAAIQPQINVPVITQFQSEQSEGQILNQSEVEGETATPSLTNSLIATQLPAEQQAIVQPVIEESVIKPLQAEEEAVIAQPQISEEIVTQVSGEQAIPNQDQGEGETVTQSQVVDQAVTLPLVAGQIFAQPQNSGQSATQSQTEETSTQSQRQGEADSKVGRERQSIPRAKQQGDSQSFTVDEGETPILPSIKSGQQNSRQQNSQQQNSVVQQEGKKAVSLTFHSQNNNQHQEEKSEKKSSEESQGKQTKNKKVSLSLTNHQESVKVPSAHSLFGNDD